MLLNIANDTIVDEVPLWAGDKPGTHHWFARLSFDPSAPGGLAREYAERSDEPGGVYRRPVWLHVGCPVEFGLDVEGDDGLAQHRRYAIVTQSFEVVVLGLDHATAADAINAAPVEAHRHALALMRVQSWDIEQRRNARDATPQPGRRHAWDEWRVHGSSEPVSLTALIDRAEAIGYSIRPTGVVDCGMHEVAVGFPPGPDGARYYGTCCSAFDALVGFTPLAADVYRYVNDPNA